MSTLLIVGSIAALLFLKKRKTSKVGKLSDSPVELENILKGVERGWYTARTGRTQWGYVVYLSGKTASGKDYEDVYPVTESTYLELTKRGI